MHSESAPRDSTGCICVNNLKLNIDKMKILLFRNYGLRHVLCSQQVTFLLEDQVWTSDVLWDLTLTSVIEVVVSAVYECLSWTSSSSLAKVLLNDTELPVQKSSPDSEGSQQHANRRIANRSHNTTFYTNNILFSLLLSSIYSNL